MKEKLKKLFFGNGSLTLLSIISLILIFAAVCLLVFSVIYKAGVIDLPFLTKSTEKTATPFLPSDDEGNKAPGYISVNTRENLEKLLSSFPYYNDFYAEFYITYTYETYNIELYRVYKYGEKYRIETLDSYGNLKKKIVCDGKRVSVTDYISLSSAIYDISEEFTFEKQAPLPSFSFFGSGEYYISGYLESGGICSVRCEYPALNMSDIVDIDMNTGLMKRSHSYIGETLVMFYDIKNFDTNYLFNELLFFT
ncbi:MAG: hypothetical protein ACI4QR_05935 [Eubacteriales bacterium]